MIRLLIFVVVGICLWMYVGPMFNGLPGFSFSGHMGGKGPAEMAANEAAIKECEKQYGAYCGLTAESNTESYSVDNENSSNGVYKIAFTFGSRSGHIYLYYTGGTGEFRNDGIILNP